MRYDERGCGLSDWEVDDLASTAGCAISRRWSTRSGAERFALLGISQGASIAIAYAVRHPERVTHLVLHGGYARGRLVRSNTPEQREEAEMMRKLAELGWGKADPSFRQFFTSQFIPGGTRRAAPVVQRAGAHLHLAGQRGALHARVRPHRRGRAAAAGALPDAGAAQPRDVRVPFAEGRLIASAIPGARFVPIDSGNHLLLDDEPGWQHWIAEVRAFLPRGGAGARRGVRRADRRASASCSS